MSSTVGPTDIQKLIDRHIRADVTPLIEMLAGADYEHGADDVGSLMDQAEALSEPLVDYESAARAAGWAEGAQIFRVDHDQEILVADDWQDACAEGELEAKETAFGSFWAVSPWLASKLSARGERLDLEFANQLIWARPEARPGLLEDPILAAIAAERDPAAFPDSDPDFRTALRDASATINELMHQCGQMAGMFDDSDGAIEEAMNEGEEMREKIAALVAVSGSRS